jgi:hypothetical protein
LWLVEYNQREAQLYEFTDKLDDTKRAKKPACGLTQTEAQLKVIQLPKNPTKLTKLTQQGEALQKQLFYSLVSVFLVKPFKACFKRFIRPGTSPKSKKINAIKRIIWRKLRLGILL